MNELTREELDQIQEDLENDYSFDSKQSKAQIGKLISAARKGLEIEHHQDCGCDNCMETYNKRYDCTIHKERIRELQQQLADATKERHSETHYQNRLDEISQLQGQVEDLSKKLGKEHTELENATKLLAMARDRVKGLEKAVPTYVTQVKQKLKEVSKGEPETWGFVSIFMQILDDAAMAKEGK